MNFYEREDWINYRHYYWCNVLEEYGLRAHGKEFNDELSLLRPEPRFDSSVRNWAGECHRLKRVCTYAILYAFKIGDEYDETIAHEVCHAYQRSFLPGCRSHGDMFFYLLRTVCGFTKAKHTHGDWNRPVLDALKLAYELYQMEHGRNAAR